ncbi:MAG: NINE protein [Clostridiales bacterium]|nr:NINE protein [Clostridiales bacterium]
MGLKQCPVCGANNSEIAKFCYSCGADLEVQQQPSVYDQPVAEYQPQYQEIQAQEIPSDEVKEEHQAPPQGTPYTQGQYQAPPQGAPYTQGQYQAPPQGAPYMQGQYQVPPQGAPYVQGSYQVPPQGVPYGQPMPPVIPYGYKQKSKLAAGLLGILIGSFGVHNFYLGYTGKAVAQLLITLLTCGFGAVISGIWALIEGIMILTGSINVDGKNVPLAD